MKAFPNLRFSSGVTLGDPLKNLRRNNQEFCINEDFNSLRVILSFQR